MYREIIFTLSVVRDNHSSNNFVEDLYSVIIKTTIINDFVTWKFFYLTSLGWRWQPLTTTRNNTIYQSFSQYPVVKIRNLPFWYAFNYNPSLLCRAQLIIVGEISMWLVHNIVEYNHDILYTGMTKHDRLRLCFFNMDKSIEIWHFIKWSKGFFRTSITTTKDKIFIHRKFNCTLSCKNVTVNIEII
jgi:hypothetical protein